MKYDRDIRIGRRILWLLLFGNGGTLGLNLYAHNWAFAAACGMWTCNVFMMLDLTKTMQGTRDRARLIEAGLNAMRNEIEKEEY